MHHGSFSKCHAREWWHSRPETRRSLKVASGEVIAGRALSLVFMMCLLYHLFLSPLILHHRINYECGPVKDTMLLTGRHLIADITCSNCKSYVGWKYVSFSHCADAQPLKLCTFEFEYILFYFENSPNAQYSAAIELVTIYSINFQVTRNHSLCLPALGLKSFHTVALGLSLG